MKFAHIEHDYDDDHDESDISDDYIPRDDALGYVLEVEREALEAVFKSEAATEWLEEGKRLLDLLNIVSRHDKEQLREAIRKEVTGSPVSFSDEITEAQRFSVASEIAKLLETTNSPYANHCTPSDDLKWVERLIVLTRAFREVLFLIVETPEDLRLPRYSLVTALEKPLQKIQLALEQGGPGEIVFSPQTGDFCRRIKPDRTPLHSYLADWLSQYLTTHFRTLKLAACVECGTIFVRDRRDNVYCSKACQNRIAYKRKKIFGSGVLRETKINPEAPSNLLSGMWVHHVRLGLGRIEAVRFNDRRLWIKLDDKSSFSERIPDGTTAAEQLAKVKDRGKSKITQWEEVADPNSLEVKVRFIQLVRNFRSVELFSSRKAENNPTFYTVEDSATLADLL